MNTADRRRRWAELRKTIDAPFGDSRYDIYGLMETCGGFPDVDLWAGSTIRQWWFEEDDGSVMVDIIGRVGLAAPVFRLDSADQVRAVVSYEDFIRAAEDHVFRNAEF